jgi:lipopolysaccharide/colanic/teichoic acid biosynthesis glycosyltransferase
MIDRRGWVHRLRFQLGGGLVVAVFLPWLVRMAAEPRLIGEPLMTISVLGNLIALLVGFYVFRRLTVYPGIKASSYILPAFTLSYAAVVLAFWAIRQDYSRFLFVSGYSVSLVWYYAMFFLRQRRARLRIGVVPFGAISSLPKIDAIDWITLPSADVPKGACDAIVADLRADLPGEWERFLADAALGGVLVYHVKELRQSLTGRVEIDHLSENNFGSLVPTFLYVNIKSLFDFGTAVVAGLALLPFLMMVAVAVKLDSPGAALFRQRRVGHGGRPFWVYKFRTMREAGATSDREAAVTLPMDARVTRLGRFLRRTRVDELPQIINILRGEMSWIGPRPEAEVLSQWYEAELPFYRYRHIVKPGITGWGQVNQGHVADVRDVLWKLQYDFYYIKNLSLWLDVLIIAKTAKTVLTGFGSR